MREHSINVSRVLTYVYTYVVSPADLVNPRIRLYVTLEVHIDSFSYRTGVEITSQLQTYNWHIWKTIKREQRRSYLLVLTSLNPL
jgi:hypothetical protein